MVSRLVDSLATAGDRAEHHAITYALIEIGDVDAVRDAWRSLESPLPIQSASLMTVIEQVDSNQVFPADVFAGLDAEDEAYRRASLRIVSSHPQWTDEVHDWIAKHLFDSPSESVRPVLETLITRFIQDERISELVGRGLSQKSPATRQLLLTAISKSSPAKPPAEWIEPLQRLLRSQDPTTLSQAIAAAAKIQGDSFLPTLKAIAADPDRPGPVRVSALDAIAARSGGLDGETFQMLVDMTGGSGAIAVSGRAAETLGAAKLTDDQLLKVCRLFGDATASQLKSLLPAFRRTRSEPVIESFLRSVAEAEAFLTITENELSEVIKRYPQEVLPQANKMLARLRAHQQQKLRRLESLRQQVALANAERGKAIFASEKAKCSSCHRVGEQGQRVGPDLTTIGANRSDKDLLESIVFPSASIVRDYEAYKLLTLDGRILTGLLVSETSEGYVLQQASGEKITVVRDDVEEMVPGVISIMPAGLDEALTESELADVVAYLQSLR